jgi:DNA ligase (NAD+)
VPVVRSGDSGNGAPAFAVARAADLKRLLEEHNRRYYVDDAPTISDAEYDAALPRARGARSATSRARVAGVPHPAGRRCGAH